MACFLLLQSLQLASWAVTVAEEAGVRWPRGNCPVLYTTFTSKEEVTEARINKHHVGDEGVRSVRRRSSRKWSG